MSERLYYIQCTTHYAYDYILWWRPNAAGYTHNLGEAGLYTEEEARAHVNCRGQEVAWHKDTIQFYTDITVSIERLRSNNIKPFLEAKKMPPDKVKKPHPRNCVLCGRLFSMVGHHPDVNECGRCT